MNRYELHIHTAECDKAAAMPAAELVRRYHEAGYAGMVVTDHYFDIFDEWFADELKGMSRKEYIHRWLKGYYAAREEGERLGFVVLPGAEVRFKDTKNDYLIYGVDEQFFYDSPPLSELGSVEWLVNALPKNACVVQAHPFRNDMTVRVPTPLFGLEGFNGGNSRFRNQMAKTFAEHYGKPITSGSDYHGGKHRFAVGGIETPKLIKTPKDLTDVLRSGEYTLIEKY
ncbi:MAG: PHP domain-containing protein [Clostridia bacterium]|nr:PHP domain-containing protein [Clostridia bacterium]